MIPVQAGTSRVEIRFKKTWDRTLGEIVSATAVIFILLLVFRQKQISRKERMGHYSHVRP
jgi:hypothetical protein